METGVSRNQCLRSFNIESKQEDSVTVYKNVEKKTDENTSITSRNTVKDILPNATGKAHIYRQISITFALCLLSVSGGATFGFTAVVLPQLEKDANFPYDKSFDSWIASITPLAMICGCLCSGSLSDIFGRKTGQIALIIPLNIGWIIMGFSSNNTMMLVGRFITGICTGSTKPISLVYIGELTDPKYRAITLFFPTAALHIGTLFSHIVGEYVNWKTACFIFTIPSVVSLIMLTFFKESPLWLLNKGRIDEGIESFRFFRSDGESAEKELAATLKNFKEETEKTTFTDIFNIIFSKPFMKSLVIIFLLVVAAQLCGINSISFYAHEMFEKTFSGDVDAYLLMLATDCLRALAGVVIGLLTEAISRKITFIVCCFTTSLALTGVVMYLFLRPVGFAWVGVVFMIAYIIIASAISCIAWSIVPEIFPGKIRGFSSGLTSSISFTLLFISVKFIPAVMNKFGAPTLYGGFALITLIPGIILIFILPDTSGKSLQDIEDTLFKNKQLIRGS